MNGRHVRSLQATCNKYRSEEDVRKKKKRQKWPGASLLFVIALGVISVAFILQAFVLHLRLDDSRGSLVLEWGAAGGGRGASSLPVSVMPWDKQQQSDGDNDDDTVHIVFSTDCSGYQHWQGIALWYAAQAAGQPGPITRIASGCTEERQKEISSEWRKIDRTGRFRVHFTAHMEIEGGEGNKYKYSNKPGGIRHWLANADPLVSESYVCLLDPDMLPLLPITATVGGGGGLDALTPRPRPGGRQVEFVDGKTGVARVLRSSGGRLEDLPNRVGPGRPAGQHFGIGGHWATAGLDSARPVWKNFSKAFVCGQGSPCVTTSVADAKNMYAVGPVYLAHVDDWRRIADAWWSAMPRVHEQYPHLLAEMYALTMAVSNLTLPWALVSNYMVSDPGTGSPTEAWSWIDDFARENATSVCAGASSSALPVATRNRSAIALPTTLHHCQRYMAGGHLFAKRRVPHDFFRCDGEPMPFDVDALMDGLAGKPSTGVVRNSFMICHLIPIVNSALEAYKRDVCNDQSGEVTSG